MIRKVLTIAGSDCSGGAGIQADLKTMTAFGVYGMSVVTALTAQNTTGVSGIMEVDPEFTAKQIDAVFTDIRPDAVKIGMAANSSLIRIITEKLKEYDAVNIVVDPVLSGIRIKERESMAEAARLIAEKTGTGVLLKGGHFGDRADDLLVTREGLDVWFYSERIDNPNTHGTGCTLSSAIACGLALGLTLEDSVLAAKEYISDALKSGLDLGRGRGPLDHACRIRTVRE